MRKPIACMLILLALAPALGAAPAEDEGILGKPYPVSRERAIVIGNADARKELCFTGDDPVPLEVYVIPDGTAHLRIDIKAEEDPTEMCFSWAAADLPEELAVSDLYDSEAGAFVFDVPMPAPSDGNHIVRCALMNRGEDDPDAREVFLIPDEACHDEVEALLAAHGDQDIRWESAEPAQAGEAPQAYVLHVVDQYGAPVPKVFANFCTDTMCVLSVGDENGTLTFEGEPGVYHVQLIRVPQGYSVDPGFAFYTPPAYGEWVLRLKKASDR